MTFLSDLFRPKSDGARRAMRLIWLLPFALMIRAAGDPETLGGRFPDPDDAFRLVQIRDLIAGQSWFDLVPRRLDPPQTVPNHWSRLGDLPVAALILVSRPFIGSALAEKAALLLWPPLLFVGFGLALACVARRLGGPPAMPSAVILGLCAGLVWQFFPGRIDHHALQATLASAALAGALARQHPAFARIAGAFSGIVLAMGLETAAILGAIGVLFASDLLFDRDRRGSVAAYTTALSSALVATFLLTTHPALYTMKGCDGPTGTVVLSVLVAMLALRACAAIVPGKTLAVRGAILAIAGAVTVFVILRIEPSCARGLAGAADAASVPIWLTQVMELTSLRAQFAGNPGSAAQFAALPVLGLSAAAFVAARFPRRRRIALEAGFCLAVQFAVGCLAIRGLFLANTLAVGPVAAALTLAIRRRGPASATVALKGMAAAAVLCFSTYAATFLPFGSGSASANALDRSDPSTSADVASQPTSRDKGCSSQRSFAHLAGLPRGLVLGSIWNGPGVLVFTHHDVMSSPHHRFKRGNELGEAVMTGNVEYARNAIGERGIDYVILCRGHPDVSPFMTALRTAPPDWLERTSGPDDDLLVFRVRKEAH